MTIRELLLHLVTHDNIEAEVLIRTKKHMYHFTDEHIQTGDDSDHYAQFDDVSLGDFVINLREEG